MIFPSVWHFHPIGALASFTRSTHVNDPVFDLAFTTDSQNPKRSLVLDEDIRAMIGTEG